MHEALLWEHEGDRIHCFLCPHECRIAEDHRGICGVRQNTGGVLEALTYGRVASVAVDPIEKKPVFHFRPGTLALSLGSLGCTMRCSHCQNWQISRAKPGESDGLQNLPPDDVVPLARQHGCEGVAFTYNEPVIWAEYVRDVASACKAAGIYTVMVTNGYITEAGLDLIGPHIDVWRVDIKGFSDETYRQLCKVRSVQPILDGAVRAKRYWKMHVEVVTNVVPTINDGEETLRGIADWIMAELGPDTPWHITRFFPYLELAHLPPTPVETLRRAREIGREAGLHFVFLGNVREPGGEDTVCPGCGKVAIERNGYSVDAQRTSAGACEACGTPLGVVEGPAG